MGASPIIQVYCSSIPILKPLEGLWQGNPVVQGHHQYLMRRAILAAQLPLLCQNLKIERIREHLSVSVPSSSIAFPTVQMPHAQHLAKSDKFVVGIGEWAGAQTKAMNALA